MKDGKQEHGKVGFGCRVKMELFDKEGNRKKLFQGNKLWEFVNKFLKVDLKLAGVTGNYVYESVGENAVTTAGIAVAMKLLGEVSETGITHMAIGIGTGGTTTLASEITTNGGQRASVTPTSATTSTTGDTIRSVHTYSFTGSFAVTEEGLLNAVSSGTLIAYRTFSAVNVASGDSLQVTHDIIGAVA